MRNIFLALLCLLLCASQKVTAQHFNGVNGSVYSPVINLAQQPASGANMPYKWGVEVVGVNSFWSNNIVSASPSRFKWARDSAHLRSFALEGSGKHDGFLRADVHILNFLLRIPHHEEWTVGAGWNIRNHSFLDRLNYSYNDSMSTIKKFMKVNAINKNLQGTFVNTQWSEWFLNASKVLESDEFHNITLGASVKFIKGMGAEIAEMSDFEVTQPVSGSPNYVSLDTIRGRYGYSSNLEDLDKANGFKGQSRAAMKGNPLSIGLDIGMVYTKKKPSYIPGFKNNDPADYDWRLSVAITDFGQLKYDLGKESRTINGVKQQKDIEAIRRMVDDASSLSKINDTLSQVLNMSRWEGYTSVSLPTKLRIDFDKNIGRHLYVNANANLDVSFLNPGVDYKSKSLSYMMVTPRWEKKRMGFSLPLYINEKGRFLAGAAVRIGPLVAGVHDFGWLFHHTPNGGAYLGIVIKGLGKKESDCPTF